MLGASALVGPVSAQPPGTRFTDADYSRAMVVDAQGGFSHEMDESARDTALSGLTAISVTTGAVGNGPRRMESVVESVAEADRWIERHPDVFVAIRRASDLGRAKESRRTGLIYNVQDTACLEGDISRIATLKGLGIRVVQLTYNKRNLCGDGCLEPGNAGLSDFGREVIAEINAQKLALDLSHGGQRTISEAVRASSAPALVTHTGCRDLVNNERNLFDRQLREISDRGGVVGIYLIAYLRSGIGQPALNARAEDLIAHLEHAVNVCGEDHVGIGSDGTVSALVVDQAALDRQRARFEERTREGFATSGEGPDVFNYVPDYNTPRRFLTLGEDLSRRGWPSSRIEKVIGGNFARAFAQSWEP